MATLSIKPNLKWKITEDRDRKDFLVWVANTGWIGSSQLGGMLVISCFLGPRSQKATISGIFTFFSKA